VKIFCSNGCIEKGWLMPDETAEMRVLSEKIKALDAKVDTYHKEVKGEMVYRSDASERRQKTYITIATLIIGFLSFFGYKTVSIWIRNTIETKSEEKIEEYITPQYINDMINLKGENAIQEATEKMIIDFDSKTKQTIIDFDNRLTVFLEEKKDSYDKIILSLNKGNIRDINGKQISSKEVTKELAQFKEDLSLIKTEDKFTFDDWLYKGLAEYNNKDYNDAIISFTEALENNPRSVNAYVMRGNSYRSLDRDVDAIEDYNNAIKISNEFVAAFSNRGYAYSKLKKYKKAIKDYRKSIEIKPEYFYSYPGLADAYLFKGDYKKA
jgi:tetratricopeptide (TPR) repeat protein